MIEGLRCVTEAASLCDALLRLPQNRRYADLAERIGTLIAEASRIGREDPEHGAALDALAWGCLDAMAAYAALPEPRPETRLFVCLSGAADALAQALRADAAMLRRVCYARAGENTSIGLWCAEKLARADRRLSTEREIAAQVEVFGAPFLALRRLETARERVSQ